MSFLNPHSSVILNYSGTLYTPTIITSGQTYFINTQTIVPAVASDSVVNFSYIIDTGSEKIYSLVHPQNISNIEIIAVCNSSNYQLLNITNYDEDLLTSLSGTVQYKFSLTNNNLLLTTLSGNSTGTNIGICSIINLSTSSAKYSLELRYYNSNNLYFYETYNVENGAISSLPLTIPLYFLNTSSGVQFKINYVDFNYFNHPGAIIQMQRQYLSENIYRVIEIPKIGDNGQSVGSFNTNNIRYKIIIYIMNNNIQNYIYESIKDYPFFYQIIGCDNNHKPNTEKSGRSKIVKMAEKILHPQVIQSGNSD
jgi:hypothetical protein